VGLILAPTSAGIVLNVLSKGKILQTETGQVRARTRNPELET
jgi:Kef-type K+ transport system membrane component KefB